MPHQGEIVVDKPGFGAFHRTDLQAKLTALGIDRLILCGITTQCCVQSTLREAVDRGFYCLTVKDACAAFDPAVQDAALTLIGILVFAKHHENIRRLLAGTEPRIGQSKKE